MLRHVNNNKAWREAINDPDSRPDGDPDLNHHTEQFKGRVKDKNTGKMKDTSQIEPDARVADGICTV